MSAQQSGKPRHVWMVRAGDNNEIADAVEANRAVAIGWSAMGNLSDLRRRDQFKDRYAECYQEETSKPRIAVNSGQLYRFTREIKIGDYVLTYLQSSREILIGQISGEYNFDSQYIHPYYPHVRQVNWLRKVSRDEFSKPARNSLGSSLTVFQIDDHLAEVHKLAIGERDLIEKEIEEEISPPFYEEVKSKADELISDMISQLGPFEMQDLVAALLRAMGYRAVSVKPGPDRGVDIEASPDALGFEKPRVKVQVKHRTGKVTGPAMREFVAVLRQSDNGLYVSTGGFTNDAEFEASRSREPLKLLSREEFIDLLLEHYEKLEPEYKTLLPLRRIWVPVE
jgi:restriction system protein